MFKNKTALVVATTALLLVAAQAQDASALAGSFTTAIGGNDSLMWTIGGAVAGFVAVVAVIGMIIRGSRSVSKSA